MSQSFRAFISSETWAFVQEWFRIQSNPIIFHMAMEPKMMVETKDLKQTSSSSSSSSFTSTSPKTYAIVPCVTCATNKKGLDNMADDLMLMIMRFLWIHEICLLQRINYKYLLFVNTNKAIWNDVTDLYRFHQRFPLGNALKRVVQRLTRLKSISFHGFQDYEQRSVMVQNNWPIVNMITNECPDLTSLDLVGFCHPTAKMVVGWCINCPNLTELLLSNCDLTESSMSMICDTCVDLKRLSLVECFSPTMTMNSFVFAHISELKNLNELSVSHSKIDNVVLQHICKVKTLHILYLSFTPISNLDCLLKLPELRILQLQCCTNITDESLKIVLAHPTLIDLDISGNVNISDRVFQNVTKTLHKINISGCTEISAVMRATLISKGICLIDDAKFATQNFEYDMPSSEFGRLQQEALITNWPRAENLVSSVLSSLMKNNELRDLLSKRTEEKPLVITSQNRGHRPSYHLQPQVRFKEDCVVVLK